MTAELRIDVHFDLICPWCLIGKRHLESAIAQMAASDPDVAVQLRWHPVQLLPGLPLEGVPFAAFYVRRLGSPQAVLARQAQVNTAAAAAGLHIDFSRIERMPNTTLALRLLDHVTKTGGEQRQATVIDQLFGAHFLQARNLGDVATLVTLAQDCGLDGATVHTLLADPATMAYAPPQRAAAPEGVPYFIFNDRYALAGAHPPQAMLRGMRQALGRDVFLEEENVA